jgi:hypothetical protein
LRPHLTAVVADPLDDDGGRAGQRAGVGAAAAPVALLQHALDGAAREAEQGDGRAGEGDPLQQDRPAEEADESRHERRDAQQAEHDGQREDLGEQQADAGQQPHEVAHVRTLAPPGPTMARCRRPGNPCARSRCGGA